MKRYELNHNVGHRFTESESGEWCKYADVSAEIGQQSKAFDHLVGGLIQVRDVLQRDGRSYFTSTIYEINKHIDEARELLQTKDNNCSRCGRSFTACICEAGFLSGKDSHPKDVTEELERLINDSAEAIDRAVDLLTEKITKRDEDQQ
jgi:hypothetical protein